MVWFNLEPSVALACSYIRWLSAPDKNCLKVSKSISAQRLAYICHVSPTWHFANFLPYRRRLQRLLAHSRLTNLSSESPRRYPKRPDLLNSLHLCDNAETYGTSSLPPRCCSPPCSLPRTRSRRESNSGDPHLVKLFRAFIFMRIIH